MIIKVENSNEKDYIWKKCDAQIIFNPVSISRNRKGMKIFDHQISKTYGFVYDEYKDLLYTLSKRELLGEIQLVQISEKKCIMNGFIYEDDQINLIATTKALVELSNLIEEYKINAAIQVNLRCENKTILPKIIEIINVIFADCRSNVYLYNSK